MAAAMMVDSGYIWISTVVIFYVRIRSSWLEGATTTMEKAQHRSIKFFIASSFTHCVVGG